MSQRPSTVVDRSSAGKTATLVSQCYCAKPSSRGGEADDGRRRFLQTSLAGVIGALVGGSARGADRVRRVGLLLGFRPPPEWIAGGLFFGPMRELGSIEGQNVVSDQRYDKQPELLPMLARELIASKVDAIVASPSSVLRAVKEATATIPIVFAETSQPVRRVLSRA